MNMNMNMPFLVGNQTQQWKIMWQSSPNDSATTDEAVCEIVVRNALDDLDNAFL